MTTVDIERLDELAKQATQGKWEVTSGDGEKVHYPTKSDVVIYSDDDCNIHPIADFSCNSTCRPEWDQEANARFVAELVNSWPVIREQLVNQERN
jgi:hypothetical protein